MKPGSLVVLIKPLNIPEPAFAWDFQLPEFGQVYTVRQLVQCPTTNKICLLLEEMCCGINKYSGEELGVGIESWIEVQPPMSLSFIEDIQFEEINTKQL